MIELRGLVAAPGLAPLTASVRVGEVVRLDGPPAAARAVLEVVAGRRSAIAGEVAWRDPRGRAVLIRAGERLPPGVEPTAAVALWRALAGGGEARSGEARARGKAGEGAAAAAAGRGFGVAPAIWLVDGPPAEEVEVVVTAADDEVRGGAGALVWTAAAARGHADRAIVVEVADAGAAGGGAAGAGTARPMINAATPSQRGRGYRAAELARGGRALVRFAGAAASSRGAIAAAMVSALWLALIAVVAATHEGFWFVEGTRGGLGWLTRLTAIGAALGCALAAAIRAAVGRAWPSMLRETTAAPALRAVALVVGDAAGAAPSAAVAALPAIWTAAASPGALAVGPALTAASAVLLAALVAGAVTRAVRSIAAAGALVGVGLAAWLMW